MKLNLLITTVLILTWATPNFCPLTFGQGSSLKALPRTPDNIAKTITAVEAAGVGDKDPGIKVLIKHFGSAATKAALLAKLRAELALLSGRPDTATAAAAPARASAGGMGGGGSAAAVPVRASHGGGGAGVSMASKPLGDIDTLEASIVLAYDTMNSDLKPLLATATVLKNALEIDRKYASARREFLSNKWAADSIIRTFTSNIKTKLDNAERDYSWPDSELLAQITLINRQINDLPRSYLENIYTITNQALDLLVEEKSLDNISGINVLDTDSQEFVSKASGLSRDLVSAKRVKLSEALSSHKKFVNEQIARDLLAVTEQRNYITEQCQNLLDELEDTELLFTDSTLSKLLNELENIVKICLEKVRIKTFTRLDIIERRLR